VPCLKDEAGQPRQDAPGPFVKPGEHRQAAADPEPAPLVLNGWQRTCVAILEPAGLHSGTHVSRTAQNTVGPTRRS
jgi:hypothetical protein